MQGRDKALAQLNGQALLQHVISRLQPQAGRVFLSVDRYRSAYESMGLTQCEDLQAGSQGPLYAVLSCLTALGKSENWLVIAPCDAPFLPNDIVARLLHRAQRDDSMGAVASYQRHLQPTFSLWHRDLVPVLKNAIEADGMRSFMHYLDRFPLAVERWQQTSPSPFFNVNSPVELAQAEEIIAC